MTVLINRTFSAVKNGEEVMKIEMKEQLDGSYTIHVEQRCMHNVPPITDSVEEDYPDAMDTVDGWLMDVQKLA